MQLWCSTPLPKGEEPRWKLRSDKYQPLAGGLLENYESDLLLEADEDTDWVGDDVANCQEVSIAAKPTRKTSSNNEAVSHDSCCQGRGGEDRQALGGEEEEEEEGKSSTGDRDADDSHAFVQGGRR
jgi:hypothetical protein